MNSLKKIVFAFVTCTSFSLVCSNPAYTYHKATFEDLVRLRAIFDNIGGTDVDNQEVPPKAFRQPCITSAIAAGALFFAQDTTTQQVVGFKIVSILDATSTNPVLQNRLQLHTSSVAAGRVTTDGTITSTPVGAGLFSLFDHAVVVHDTYNYTKPDVRYRGINTQLTQLAYQTLTPAIVAAIGIKEATHLGLVYKLSNYTLQHLVPDLVPERVNPAGSTENLLGGQSNRMARLFAPLAQQVAQQVGKPVPTEAIAYRTKTVTPLYYPDSSEMVSVDGGIHDIPAVGCALLVALK